MNKKPQRKILHPQTYHSLFVKIYDYEHHYAWKGQAHDVTFVHRHA